MMFSSRTLTDRNNDPLPYAYFDGVRDNRPAITADREWMTRLDRRPEFQYGTLPENPILIEWREAQILSGDSRRIERELRWMEDRHIWRDATDEQFAHAKRVLSLLAAVTR